MFAAEVLNASLSVPFDRFDHDLIRWFAAQNFSEEDAVVTAALFLANDGDVIHRACVARQQLIKKTACRHAVADDHKLFFTHWQLLCAAAIPEGTTRTAHTLNSGIRLTGSRAGLVTRLAAPLPPQWNGAKTVSGRISGLSCALNSALPRRLSTHT